MPGFSINGNGNGPSNEIGTLRAHRWTITQLGPITRDSLLIARDVTLPQMRIERQEVLGGLIWYKFAKSIKYEDVEIIFYDNGDVLEDIETWKAQVWTPDSGIKQHSAYKHDCIFTLRSDHIIEVITLKNAWPASISHSRLSYTSSEIKQINLTLAYDWAESSSAS